MSLYGSPSQPDFAAALATIQGWDKDRLQELLNDEEKFDALIKGLSQIKSLRDEKEMLMASNRSLAEYNLSQEPVLKDMKSQLADKHREAMRTAEKVKNAKRDLDDKSGNVEPDTLLALLQTAHAEAEEASDSFADDFLNKRIDSVDEFLDTFLERRKLCHMRRIKVDKMKELLDAPQQTTMTPSRRAPPLPAAYNLPAPVAAPNAINNWGAAPAYSTPPGGANLPYPINPTASGMPMYP